MNCKIFDFIDTDYGEHLINEWLKITPGVEIRFINTVFKQNNATRTIIFYSTRKDKLERLNQVSDEM